MHLVLNQLYKEQLDKIWLTQINNHPETQDHVFIKRGYAIEEKLMVGNVLFLGMNPSYPNGHKESGGFYDITNKNAYFDSIIKFRKEIPISSDFCHHDILFVRHTNQKEILSALEQAKFHDFFIEQLLLSRDIILAAEPKLIVVLNAGARDIIQKYMFPFSWDNDFDKDLGAIMLKRENGMTIPVIFSGMLSGQRAMDFGTKRTLLWHIQKIIGQL